MLKKHITYTDYNDNVVEEDFYFNLTKPELAELQLDTEGGLKNKIEKMVKENNLGEAMKLFHSLIIKSFGIKAEDGKRFIKSDEISLAFTQSPAYEVLYSEVLESEESAINFILAVLPKDIAEQVKAEAIKNA